MIHLEKDQQLKSDPKIRVAVPTGDYNETDLIECYGENDDPENPTMMYQAQYISFGNFVYQQSEEWTEDQVNALKANVPVDQVLNNKKMIEGKNPVAKYEGAIITRKGLKGKRRFRDGTLSNPNDKNKDSLSDNTKNDLIQKTPEPTPSPTPEPVSTPSPTPEPSPSPTPDLTPSPTPEISPSPSPTSTPSPTPDVSSNASSTIPVQNNISTTTDNFIEVTSTTTPNVISENSTSTLPTNLDSINQMPTSTVQILNSDANIEQGGSTSTDQVVSMAKNSIKRLFR